jgi:hypothetical protein
MVWPDQSRAARTARRPWTLGRSPRDRWRLLLLCLVLLSATACGGVSRPQGTPWGAEVAFFFTSYAEALRAVTDLGLQPSAAVCGSGFGSYANGTQEFRGPWWQPVGVEDSFDQSGGFLVRSTPAAASDWLDRLQGVRGARVDIVYTNYTPINCPDRTVEGTPPPDAARYVPREQVGTTLRVAFARPAVGYDGALNALTELGLRLADPCYEQARAAGKMPSWHAMGQEMAFARDGTLVVAVGPEASERWREQVSARPDTLELDTPFTPACS